MAPCGCRAGDSRSPCRLRRSPRAHVGIRRSRPLRDRELVCHLPSGSVGASTPAARLAYEADREASFSVYETDHPSTLLDQPFLLIVRTVRIVTVHDESLGRVPDGYTG